MKLAQNYHFRIILVIIILLITSLACNAITGPLEEEPYEYDEYYDSDESHEQDEYDSYDQEESPEPPVGYDSEPQPETETLFCPDATDKILGAATEFYEEEGTDNGDEPEQEYLVTYSISGDNIDNPVFEDVAENLANLQNDKASHQDIWNYFITLIPMSERDELAEYAVFTDGEGNVLAAVTQTTYDPSLWVLEVDINDSADKLNLTYTLIHEYAHLLTLGPDQVTPSIAVFDNPEDDDIYTDEVSACPDYFPGEGCSQPDSYVNAFYNQFWADISEEWQDINLIEDDDEYYEALDDFYYKYEDRFVTDYAATNPEEDMAEAFTFFVLSTRPAGDTIAEEKILFFYDYPELVQLRDEITSGICSLNQ